MDKYCLINNETKDVAQLDGRNVIVSHPQLLSLAKMCGLIDGKKYDTLCVYPNVCDVHPHQVGLYIVAHKNREDSDGVVIGLDNKRLYLSLGFWNGTHFVVNGQLYHYGNVSSWLLICGEKETAEFFKVKGRTL